MVQREVADRLRPRRAARATGPPRCSPSSPARCASCARCPRTVFHPEPNVDSALVVMRRRAPAPPARARRARARRVRAPAQGPRGLAGAHARRAGRHPRRHPRRARVDSATRRTRAPSGCRRRTGRGLPTRSATSASPSSGRARRTPTLGPVLRELAYAKLNLVLHVGRRRDDGMHPVCSLVASIDLADEVDRRAEGVGRGHRRVRGRSGRQPGRPGARRVPLARGQGAAAARRHASGSACRWRPGSAAAAPTPPPRCGSRTELAGHPLGREELRPPRRRPRLRRAQPARPAARARAGSGRARSSRWTCRRSRRC